MPTLNINEVFHSIQGESSRMGMPCVFVRLRGCHLRCRYCDTSYAFHDGQPREVDDILREVRSYKCKLVEITGGEPLLQPGVHDLMTRLCDDGFTVLLETSGACDISACDRRVIRIVDIKTPGSGEADRNDWSMLDHLQPWDEVKFVICDREDYEWARAKVRNEELDQRVACVLFSPVHAVEGDADIEGSDELSLTSLAEWIIEDRLPVRLQTQLHKLIWHPLTRGV